MPTNPALGSSASGRPFRSVGTGSARPVSSACGTIGSRLKSSASWTSGSSIRPVCWPWNATRRPPRGGPRKETLRARTREPPANRQGRAACPTPQHGRGDRSGTRQGGREGAPAGGTRGPAAPPQARLDRPRHRTLVSIRRLREHADDIRQVLTEGEALDQRTIFTSTVRSVTWLRNEETVELRLTLPEPEQEGTRVDYVRARGGIRTHTPQRDRTF